MTVEPAVRSIRLTDAWLDRQKAMAIPGAYWNSEAKAYVLDDPSPRAAAVALKMFPGLALEHPELLDQRAALSQEVRPFNFADDYWGDNELNEHVVIAERTTQQLHAEDKGFYDFQRVDLWYLAAVLQQHGAAYMGWERGLGKTLAAAALLDELECKRSLIVCPNTAKQSVWEPELRRFCPWLEVVVLRNTKAQRDKDLGYVKQLIEAGLDFALVIHYEALDIIAQQKSKSTGWNQYGTWDIVIADEAHRIANPKTKMARALKKVPTKYKLALSGSIIQNHAEELFSPLQWLYPTRYKSKWRDWNDRYLDYVENGYSKVCVGIKIEKLKELRDELGVFMVYRRKEDELDLPARTEETRYVELSKPQRKAYEELQDSCLTQLDDGSIIKATDGLVLLTRLRQVATGLDLVSGELVDSTKQDLAVELIEDNPDEAFVVFSWYKAAAYSLAERLGRLGIECFTVTGDTKPSDRADYIQAFQAGNGRVFIGTLSTLGESVTLHRASNAVFLDRSWNPATNAQAADRIYRIGQSKPVTITHIVARDTVDELRVQPVLADKDALRKLILGG